MSSFQSLILLLGLVAIARGVAVNTECLGNHEDHFLENPVPEEIKLILDDGERAFGVNLIKSLFHDFNETGIHKNIFISPASIYQTLMLTYFGAKEQTETDLAKTLGFEGQVERADVIKNYLFERAFQAIRERDPNLGYTLTHANKFYFDRTLPLNECLQLVLQAELEALDFTKPEKARLVINNWVSQKTHDKIPKLLPAGSLTNTRVALVNAAYFKGQWVSKFEAEKTKTNNFFVRRDKITMTEFMEQKGKFNYYTSEELRAHVLEMPYNGDEVSMVVILPPFEDDSLYQTVSRLTPKSLQGVMAEVKSGFYQVDDLTVKLPKFKIEQEFQLEDTLAELGLETIFGGDSNLSGFLSEKAGEDVADVTLSKAIHKSFIEVNEEGSEAAAATALFEFRSARPLFNTEFIADHPFIFLIYDKPTDTVLFFGMYQDPKK